MKATKKVHYQITDLLNRMKYDIMTGGLKKALIFVIVMIVVAGIVVLPSYLAYNKVKTLIIHELGQNAQDVAITTAILVEQNYEAFETLTSVTDYQEESYDQSYYLEMNGLFRKIKNETGVTYLFAEKKVSESQVAYVFDGQDPTSPDFSALGDLDGLQAIEESVYENGEPAITDMIPDPEWGYFLSGFAPIHNPKTGEVLGITGVDYSLDYVSGSLRNVKNLFILGVMVIIFLTSVILFRFLHINFNAQETDYITGLRNRHFHELQLRKAIREAKLSSTALSMIMMDLDNFKQVNDQHGHLTGDAVLKAVARVIKSQTRDQDICSRYGGDEFVIILPNADEVQAIHIGERIREVIEGIAKLDEAKEHLFSTVSVGVAQWKKGMNADMLTECADQALYESKSFGRNLVSVYREPSEGGAAKVVNQ